MQGDAHVRLSALLVERPRVVHGTTSCVELADALAELSERQRACLVLRFLADQSVTAAPSVAATPGPLVTAQPILDPADPQYRYYMRLTPDMKESYLVPHPADEGALTPFDVLRLWTEPPHECGRLVGPARGGRPGLEGEFVEHNGDPDVVVRYAKVDVVVAAAFTESLLG